MALPILKFSKYELTTIIDSQLVATILVCYSTNETLLFLSQLFNLMANVVPV